jgi:hypothetical protein
MSQEKTIRWKAIWTTPAGNQAEAFFYSVEQRGVARIDFQLKMMDLGRQVPNSFALNEAPNEFEKILILPERKVE